MLWANVKVYTGNEAILTCEVNYPYENCSKKFEFKLLSTHINKF